MRVLISDLTSDELGQLGLALPGDAVFDRTRLEHGHACLGCFGCWTRAPGRCVVHDGLDELGMLLGRADELLVISRNAYGAYSPLVKRALDRALPYVHPCFRVLDGELHHRMRYDGSLRTGSTGGRTHTGNPQTIDLHAEDTAEKHAGTSDAQLRERIVLYGSSTPAERAGFLAVVQANEINQGTDVAGVWFCEDAGGIKQLDAAENAWPRYRAHVQELGVKAWRETLLADSDAASRYAASDDVTGPKSHAPHVIGLLLGSPRGNASASHALLEDFAEALLAYDRLSSRGDEDHRPPRFTRFRSLPTGKLRTETGTATTPGAEHLTSCDTLVIGYPLYTDALPSNLLATLETVEKDGSLTPGTRIYAICNLGFYEPVQAETSFLVLARWCEAVGAQWCGGLAVGAGGLITRLTKSPRMGMMRRPVAEATDRLIAAVRAGLTVREAAEAFGATEREAQAAARNVIHAYCPMPRLFYKLGAEATWHSQCRKAGADINAAPGL